MAIRFPLFAYIMSFVYPFFIERCVFLRIKSYYDDIYYTYTLFFIPFAFGALYRGTALHCTAATA